MAGKIPIIPLPGAKGIPGTNAKSVFGGDPYTGNWAKAGYGTWGTVIGGGVGGVPGAALGGLIGSAIGTAVDWMFGKSTTKKAKPAIPPRMQPAFSPTQTYSASVSNLSDPGSSSGMQMEPNVRFSAAQNLQRKLNQGLS